MVLVAGSLWTRAALEYQSQNGIGQQQKKKDIMNAVVEQVRRGEDGRCRLIYNNNNENDNDNP